MIRPAVSVMLVALAMATAMATYPVFVADLRGFGNFIPSITVSDPVRTTLWLFFARVLIGVIFTLFFCWVLVRTDTPLKRLMEFLFWLNFFIPLGNQTIAWIYLFDPAYGLVNQTAMKLGLAQQHLFSIYALAGIILAEIPLITSTGVMFVTPVLRNISHSLSNSAFARSSAPEIKKLVYEFFPLLWPALLGSFVFGFVRAMETFGSNLILGIPIKIFLAAKEVLEPVAPGLPDYPTTIILSAAFMFCVLFIMFVNRCLTGNRQYITVSRKNGPVRPLSLGKWKYMTLSLCLLYLLVFLVAPLITLLVSTFMKVSFYFNIPNPYTLAHWKAVLSDFTFFSSLGGVMLVASVLAIVGTLIWNRTSCLFHKTNQPERRGYKFLPWFPYGLLTFLLAIGLLVAIFGVPLYLSLYSIIYIMIITVIVKELPLGGRTADGKAPAFSLIATAVIISLTTITDIGFIALPYLGSRTLSRLLPIEFPPSMAPEKSAVKAFIVMALLIIIGLMTRIFRPKQNNQQF